MTLPTLNYESPSFLTRSESDLKLKPYTRLDVIRMMGNIRTTQNRTRNKRKKVLLTNLMNDLITLL